MSRTALFLDEKGLKDVGKILEKARKQVLEVQSQSSARLAASEEKGMDAMVACSRPLVRLVDREQWDDRPGCLELHLLTPSSHSSDRTPGAASCSGACDQ
jgi:hypothetical protein